MAKRPRPDSCEHESDQKGSCDHADAWSGPPENHSWCDGRRPDRGDSWDHGDASWHSPGDPDRHPWSESDWRASSSWETVQAADDDEPWLVLGKPKGELASVRFTVRPAPPEGAGPARACSKLGPERLRVVGDAEALGDWDQHLGIDLFWEGSEWTSTVIDLLPEQDFRCRVLHLTDAPDILELHPSESMEKRTFRWDDIVELRAPRAGEVLEVTLELGVQDGPKSVLTSPRAACVLQAPEDFARRLAHHQEGSQRIYAFDGPAGVTVDFCLYLPPQFGQAKKPWPLLVFLHAMHSRLDGDISLFYESEAPPQLLLDTPFGNNHCPGLLRDAFVVLCPGCPRDPTHMYGSGVWFRSDWYGAQSYLKDVETDMAALIEMVTQDPRIDRGFVAVTGTSMGGMGCLEFASRRPGLFKACVPVAAHYEFDVDELVERLTRDQQLPFWFFHGIEDSLCEFEPIDTLVKKLRARSRAEVRLTAYNDTWSYTGHCADRVSYQVSSRSEGQPALGDELFRWILDQRQRT